MVTGERERADEAENVQMRSRTCINLSLSLVQSTGTNQLCCCDAWHCCRQPASFALLLPDCLGCHRCCWTAARMMINYYKMQFLFVVFLVQLHLAELSIVLNGLDLVFCETQRARESTHFVCFIGSRRLQYASIPTAVPLKTDRKNEITLSEAKVKECTSLRQPQFIPFPVIPFDIAIYITFLASKSNQRNCN